MNNDGPMLIGNLNRYGFRQADYVWSVDGISPAIITDGHRIGHSINILQPMDGDCIKLHCNRSEPMKGYEGDSVGITFVKSGNVHSPVTHDLSRAITTLSDHDIGVIVEGDEDGT